MVGYDMKLTLHDPHLNIIRCFKGLNIIFYSWGGHAVDSW
jgi:hypothetical protein